MTLAQAIASSPGNKATIIVDRGATSDTVIIQERWANSTDSWYHVWRFSNYDIASEVQETDIASIATGTVYGADLTSRYWRSME